MKFSAILFCLAAVASAAPSEMVGVTLPLPDFQNIWRTGQDHADEKRRPPSMREHSSGGKPTAEKLISPATMEILCSRDAAPD
ncbi:hypothetical protein CMUS01_13469 [Colletotrichum musicola]|uniref:Uncharacterized protein n=1 Tax=Colletotrichum musicola TaxID=2175873 RepID=A0A8H6JCC6_9PEZI|nr:hypothetical protein CMUS01_13469 [Colletotrichum musicola]